MVVEVTEEGDEAERVGQHHHVHGVREVTVSKQVVGGVDGHYEELELGRKQTDKQTDRRNKRARVRKYQVADYLGTSSDQKLSCKTSTGGLRQTQHTTRTPRLCQLVLTRTETTTVCYLPK